MKWQPSECFHIKGSDSMPQPTQKNNKTQWIILHFSVWRRSIMLTKIVAVWALIVGFWFKNDAWIIVYQQKLTKQEPILITYFEMTPIKPHFSDLNFEYEIKIVRQFSLKMVWKSLKICQKRKTVCTAGCYLLYCRRKAVRPFLLHFRKKMQKNKENKNH